MKKFTVLLAAFILAVGTLCTAVSAQDGDKTVTLRIEGVDGNLFYQSMTTSAANLEELLAEADALSDNITIDMQDSYYGGKYIVAVNEVAGGTYGTMDGWMDTVNGVAPSVGVSSTEIKDKDVIVLYYGVSYDMGFQTPKADISNISQGIITFTSVDTTYDANDNYKPTESINPVAGATVTWYYGDKSVEYTTDDKGQIAIDDKYLTAGDHKLAISKKADNGMPLVLRFAPDYVVNVVKDVHTTDNSNWMMYVLLLGAAITTVVTVNRKAGYEK